MMRNEIDAFQLKIIAIIGMTFDHIATTFGAQMALFVKLPMYFVGGLTFPIMGFLLIEGFHKTRDRKKYALRLLLWALVAQLPYMWGLHTQRLNVLFTLLVCLLVLIARERIPNDALFLVVLIGATLATLTLFDWGGFGILLVYAYYAIRDPQKRIWMPISAMTAFMVLSSLLSLLRSPGQISTTTFDYIALSIAFFMGSLLVIPLLLHYNGERGRPMRTFFYAYYPGHLAVLAALYALFVR